ncbi:uncharacterized protein LOC109849115 [Asparagus officinalis]|uniref:uncharacterized protein LOC109849115 n=1 Tax=Asparagus officinalis TaxID=4686 RepID=UPI00098E5774|nr:uncharacterized protein LOC109849115 [Asparagus officinalis]
MERPTPSARPKSPRKAKAKRQNQQPMKVVYITNPIRFNTSASEFRSLVQELTGKDSDIADNLAKYSDDTRAATVAGCAAVSSSSGDNSAGLDHGPLKMFDESFDKFPWFVEDCGFGNEDAAAAAAR